MEAFGELFGAIAEIFGGVAEVAGETGIEVAAAGVMGAAIDSDDAPDASATYERYLAGAPRALHVNDR